MTKKEQIERRRLDRKVRGGRATYKEILRAIDLGVQARREAEASIKEEVGQ